MPRLTNASYLTILHLRRDFKRLWEQGSLLSVSGWQLRSHPNGLNVMRVGFVVPKRYLKLAVQRNRLKRHFRTYLSAKRMEQLAIGKDVAIVLNHPWQAGEYPQLEAQLDALFALLTDRAKQTDD